MSLPLTPTAEDERTVAIVARAVIPMLVAAAVTALVLVAVRAEPIEAAAGYHAAPSPAPYSEMHARIAQPPGEPEPQPPTF